MAATREQIEAANREFVTAFGRRDAAAIGRLYTDEAQVFPPNSDVVRGAGNISDFWESVFGLGLTAAALDTVEVEASSDTAVEVGRYRLMAGNALADQGKYVVVWKNQDGRWKLHRDIWNTSQPAARQG